MLQQSFYCPILFSFCFFVFTVLTCYYHKSLFRKPSLDRLRHRITFCSSDTMLQQSFYCPFFFCSNLFTVLTCYYHKSLFRKPSLDRLRHRGRGIEKVRLHRQTSEQCDHTRPDCNKAVNSPQLISFTGIDSMPIVEYGSLALVT
jgi:hypothetical protein